MSWAPEKRPGRRHDVPPIRHSLGRLGRPQPPKLDDAGRLLVSLLPSPAQPSYHAMGVAEKQHHSDSEHEELKLALPDNMKTNKDGVPTFCGLVGTQLITVDLCFEFDFDVYAYALIFLTGHYCLSRFARSPGSFVLI